MTLAHEGNNVPDFYSSLSGPALGGIEATGSMARLTLVMAVATELLAGEIEYGVVLPGFKAPVKWKGRPD